MTLKSCWNLVFPLPFCFSALLATFLIAVTKYLTRSDIKKEEKKDEGKEGKEEGQRWGGGEKGGRKAGKKGELTWAGHLRGAVHQC